MPTLNYSNEEIARNLARWFYGRFYGQANAIQMYETVTQCSHAYAETMIMLAW